MDDDETILMIMVCVVAMHPGKGNALAVRQAQRASAPIDQYVNVKH